MTADQDVAARQYGCKNMHCTMDRARFLVGSLLAAGSALVPLSPAYADDQTALDRYVASPDSTYSYKLIGSSVGDRTIFGPGYRVHVLELTSQRWRSAAEVDRPLWKHWLTIVEPRHVRTDIAALIIGGGSNHDKEPPGGGRSLIDLALLSRSVVAELSMVPNQPLRFAGEERPRSEDALIAYTWDRFLKTGDETWPARLPMTKSVVRAMDAVTDFCRRGRRGPSVKRFVIGGSSKRGWTTWTTAAVDRRVVGIVPMVIDVLNVPATIAHEYRAYGFLPPALADYDEMGIMKWLGTPQMNALLRIEDPYTYRQRYTMPKLIVNATGDQYFAPDNSRFYFNALPREKYLRYLPNTNHSLSGTQMETAKTVLAFYNSIIDGLERPNLTVRYEGDGSIIVAPTGDPHHVRLWQANDPRARDFRLESIGPAFEGRNLHDQGGIYVAEPDRRRTGWQAAFVEVSYKNVAGHPFTITSGVRIYPDTLPFRSARAVS